jgi:hypothetical protein
LNSGDSHDILGASILNYAINLREQTARQFDQTNATRLNQTLGDVNRVIFIKVVALMKGCNIGVGARFDAFALTTKSVDVLVSALHMARQRAVLETFTLLRVALETACTSYHIFKDQDAYTEYLGRVNLFRPSNAISLKQL